MFRKCYSFSTHGLPANVLSALHEVPVPTLGKDDVLVHMKALSLNPVGYKQMTVFPSFMVKKPRIPDTDFSGVVVQVGRDAASEFKVGDEVAGWVHFATAQKNGEGAFTEIVKTTRNDIVKKPTNLSFEESACLAMAGVTSYESLTTSGLKKGGRLFVNGGSGGTGLFGVQIGRWLVGPEGKVVASCSAANAELVLSLGADEVVDYRSVNLQQHLAEKYGSEPFDVIYDTVGTPELFYKSPLYLHKKGQFINIAANIDGLLSMFKIIGSIATNIALPRVLGGVPRKFRPVFAKGTKESLSGFIDLCRDGRVKPVIDSEYSFSDRDQVLLAFDRMMSGRTRGKIVVKNSNPSPI